MASNELAAFREKMLPYIEKYQQLVVNGEESEYNEEEVKLKFINPLLEALGWDVKSEEVKPEKRTLRELQTFP